MIVCLIEKVLEYNVYELKSQNKKQKTVLEFYGLNRRPEVGDKILIHENLLDINWPYYTQPYAFELKLDMTPYHVMALNKEEFIVLGFKGKNYVLKRVYG